MKNINHLNFDYIISRFRRTPLIDEIKKFSNQKIILCNDNQVTEIYENECLEINIDNNVSIKHSIVFSVLIVPALNGVPMKALPGDYDR